MKFVDMVSTLGVMAKGIKAIGLITKCMGRDIFGGLMVKNMKENSMRIRDREMENSNGKMAVNTKDNG